MHNWLQMDRLAAVERGPSSTRMRELLASIGMDWSAGTAIRWLLCLLLAMPLGAQEPDSELPRHELEIRALTDPRGVIAALPSAYAAARQTGDYRESALLALAHANACRMIADWRCQRTAGAQAQEYAEKAGLPLLAVRGLIAESRARMALQDYTRAEHLLGAAEAKLLQSPSAELSADVALAYSSLSDMLGKFQLSFEYAQRGLDALAADQALSMQVRLLRNRARAQAKLGLMNAARASLAEALNRVERVVDPKLSAELYLEAARLARSDGDRERAVIDATRVLGLARDLGNAQLAGQAHEIIGMSALDALDQPVALKELELAVSSFRAMKLDRDELRVLQQQVRSMIQFKQPAAQWAPLVARMLDLDANVSSLDRAQASDDFDARLKYAQQELDLVRLERDAALSREREQSMASTQRLTQFLVLLSVGILIALGAFYWTLRRSNQRLQAALDARWQALMQTSHELRNPISGVLGLSELLLKMPLTPPQRSMIEAIRSAGGTIGKLAQDLLDRGQLESGRLSLSLQAGSLQHLAEGVSELYRPRAREKGLVLSVRVSPELAAPVMIDEERLQQVLSNLVGNSLKFTESGSIEVDISLLARSSDGRLRVRFKVSDSGPGMSAEEQAGLFRPFSKGVAGKRHRAGAGLGLAISADLVRLMGGTISVSSEPGRGSQFSFEIEVRSAEVRAPAASAAAGDTAQGNGLRVLLVDDDEDCALALSSQLEMLGCAVDTAASSQAARQRLSSNQYDLMLLDVELPDGRGPDFARTLRSGEGPVTDRSVRIAIASGHPPPDVLPSGVDEWLMKPVMLERLNMLLASVRANQLLDHAA